MKRILLGTLIFMVSTVLLASLAIAQVLPGATVEERAINGAKAYIKKHKLKNPTLTVLQNALFKNAQPKYDRQWEKLTGMKIKSIPYGYTDIPSKIMAEAVAKTGQWDIFNHFPYSIPDAWGAGVIQPLDAFAKKGKPDFSGIESGLRAQQWYQGKLTFFLLDGDHLALVIRKDIVDLAKNDYKAKFGKEPGCPETMSEWEQMAKYFHTKKGQTRWGKKFDKPLYGSLAYRSINFSYRHFPAYFGGLLFDKNMNPRINTPRGIQAIKEFGSSVKYMPPRRPGLGHAADLSLLGKRTGFLGHVFPLDRGVRKQEPQEHDQGPADHLHGSGRKSERQARSAPPAGGGSRLGGQPLQQTS